ncbi:hypothetical protein O8C79_02375 [Aliarcobacter butzleri]|uniref:hypothetical protein n=1 Tax=Aliarcobacter butzleri TaxID=28197 RepID=UPI00263C5D60|nr:hypothetical protein [Aliarcobacter butzleri]MDN5104139.1 hypothetical protein [Aliarcobacter butzleri]
MSIELMNKAWKTNFKGNDLLILLSLSDNASDEGYCFPSWNTIRQKTKVSKGTLSYTLKAFEYFGLIKRVHRKREDGSNKSNEYLIKVFDIDIEKFKKYKQELSLSKNQSSENELAPSSDCELHESSLYESLEEEEEKIINQKLKTKFFNEFYTWLKADGLKAKKSERLHKKIIFKNLSNDDGKTLENFNDFLQDKKNQFKIFENQIISFDGVTEFKVEKIEVELEIEIFKLIFTNKKLTKFNFKDFEKIKNCIIAS